MAEAVVDVFEIVEVQVHDNGTAAVSSDKANLLVGEFEETTSVEEAGQVITQQLAVQFSGFAFAGRDVSERDYHCAGCCHGVVFQPLSIEHSWIHAQVFAYLVAGFEQRCVAIGELAAGGSFEDVFEGLAEEFFARGVQKGGSAVVEFSDFKVWFDALCLAIVFELSGRSQDYYAVA